LFVILFAKKRGEIRAVRVDRSPWTPNPPP
jgi:hypothetical protein